MGGMLLLMCLLAGLTIYLLLGPPGLIRNSSLTPPPPPEPVDVVSAPGPLDTVPSPDSTGVLSPSPSDRTTTITSPSPSDIQSSELIPSPSRLPSRLPSKPPTWKPTTSPSKGPTPVPSWVLSNTPSVQEKPRLSFDTTKTFKILHLTDLHFGEAPFTDWGPEADRKTLVVIQKLIEFEVPDLIVLGGDQLTGNNVDANATLYYDIIANAIESFAIPYALIFGNHDDTDLEVELPNGTLVVTPAKTSRIQLLQSAQQHDYSLIREGPSDVFGVSNYMLSVHRSDMDDTVALQIAFFDSGGGSLPQQILSNQLDWYHAQRLDGVPVIGFQHIPTEDFKFENQTCSGYNGEGGIAPLESDPAGELSSLGQDLSLLVVGHNHGNSYCCQLKTYNNLHVCFGRHSGYGGYGGEWEKGGRVVEATALEGGSVQWRSWVRMESGNVIDEYDSTTTI